MVNVIPVPAKSKLTGGQFCITARTRLTYLPGTPKGRMLAADFVKYLDRITGAKHEVCSAGKTSVGDITLATVKTLRSLGNEGYRLAVTSRGVVIRALKPAGLFYGLQSLRQMVRASAGERAAGNAVNLDCCEIEDVPRFSWRGMHYDPSRRFFGLSHVLEFIDTLASYKFNVLHLHLTDDQGWRIEIKKYPKLTEVGAWRNGTRNHYWQSAGDRKRYGGFYSQEDIRTIVKYAAERFITVVPEIEMPGHAQAAVAAYPQFSCTGGPHKVWTRWGVSKDVYCAGNDETFEFLQGVLEEVIELFPGKYIHIGGDECPKDRWKTCPKCCRRIIDNHLADENELQSYFINRVEKFVNARGRRIIGWDEILDGQLSKTAAIMSWRGYEGGWKAAARKKYAVMTPCEFTYLDRKPSPRTRSGQPFVLTMKKVYSFDPAKGFAPSQLKYVLGAQGAMWSEYFNSPQEFHHHLFPRICAMAEVLWSEESRRNFADFRKRLKKL